jgi:hypothetical protein
MKLLGKLSVAFLTVRLAGAVAIIFFFSHSSAQTISKAEYFFDADPGIGSATSLIVPSDSDPLTFTSAISTAGLDPGYHILFVRTKSSDGFWSLYEYQEFIIEVPIEKAEYFFDADPGIGNGYPLPIAGGQLVLTAAIPTAALRDGEHVLFVRTRQGDRWSLSAPVPFYIQTRIVAAEYFIDADPGFGNGTPIDIAVPSHQVTFTTSVGVGPLPYGDHYLFVRTKDILGQWSFYDAQLFTVDVPLPVDLTHFGAVVTEDNNVQLIWETLTEHLSDFFSVEYSGDGLAFAELRRVPAAGESKVAHQYGALHDQPIHGNNYYRLRMVDQDGNASISKIVSARLDDDPRPSVYPNPVHDQWVIVFPEAGNATTRLIELFDLNNKTKLSRTVENEKMITLTREGLSNGIYLLRITSSKGSEVLKIIFR